ADLGPSPVAVGCSQGISLAKLVLCRIDWYDVHHQLAQCSKELDVGIRLKTLRVICLRPLCRCMQFLELLDHTTMEQQRPAVSLHQSSTSPSISSSRFAP